MTLSPAREATRRECLVDAAVRDVTPRLGSSAVMLSAWLNTFPELAADMVRERFIANGHAKNCASSTQLRAHPTRWRPCDCGYSR